MRLEQCRVYVVTYTAYGREGVTIGRIKKCVMAIDVPDLVTSMTKELLGTELTESRPDGQFVHEVVERIEIESAELVGRLHGVTDAAFSIIRSVAG